MHLARWSGESSNLESASCKSPVGVDKLEVLKPKREVSGCKSNFNMTRYTKSCCKWLLMVLPEKLTAQLAAHLALNLTTSTQLLELSWISRGQRPGFLTTIRCIYEELPKCMADDPQLDEISLSVISNV